MHFNFKVHHYKLFFSIVFFSIAFLFFYVQQEKNTIDIIKNNLQKEIFIKEKITENYFQKIINNYSFNNSWSEIQKSIPENLFSNEGLAYFIFEEDKLFFWSDNSIPLSKINKSDKNKIIKLENGYYRVFYKKFEKYSILCLSLIKNEFTYQNDYLVNGFFKGFTIPNEIGISLEKSNYQLYSVSGDFLFSIQENSVLQIREKYIYIILILCIIGFILFCSFLFIIWDKTTILSNFPLIKFLLFFLVIVSLRILIFYFNFPSVLYDSKLFSPYYYAASEYLPSLGDLLINVCIFLFFSYVFFTKVKIGKQLINASNLIKSIMSVIVLFTIITLFYFYVILCKSIVIDSSIQMVMSDIFELTFESIVGSWIIFSLSVSFILFSIKLFNISKIISKNYHKQFISFIISVVLFILFPFHIFWKEGFFYPLFLILFLFLLFIFDYFKEKISIFQRIFILILFFSFFSTFTFYKYNDNKEKDKRKLLIQKMSAENDPIAEYLFKDVMQKIQSDTLIKRKLKLFYPEDSIVNYLKSTYFKGYLSKYSEQVTLCKDFQLLLLNNNNINVNCDKYFYDKITLNGFPTQTENFYSLDYGSGSNSYIAVIRYFENESDSLLRTSLYIEMDAKFISKDLGYPELLIDKKLNILHDISDYSYAKYVNKQLVKRFGKCFYENKLTENNDTIEFRLFEMDGYNHMLYNVNKRIDFIVSKQKVNLFERLAPFSNIFITFSIFFFILLLSTAYFRQILPGVFNFKTRLQIAILSIILISFLIIGATTLVYISKLNNDKNTELLTEKTHSVLVELEHKFGYIQTIDPALTTQINDMLVKLSNVFFTDINLYNIDGKLIASSRMQIFDEGLISTQMNPKAFFELRNKSKTQYVDNENIGKNEYLSSYMPFRNIDNKLIAYINLPYFAKQGDLKKEISSFLKAYLNIYLFLIIIAVTIALFVSNYITRPLKLIINNLGNIKLGKKNEKINWSSNDEIGNLIIEYNSMIDQLAISAEKLSKSEREVAWREMAKQVAHEIKNPLTPMKLSIQHLQRAWNDKVPDWDDRLKRLTNTIVEQIDSLSFIASEFSDFAKMPRSDFEKVDVSTSLTKTIDLFKVSCEYNIKFTIDIIEDCYIYADKKQMLRVFNNLIKNSIQAISNKKDGEILISLFRENDFCIITFKDNGIGIDTSLQSRIFSPYFTTKSGGTGLGLAMVKNIIESMDGKIWFESEKESGTTFFIQLKLYIE